MNQKYISKSISRREFIKITGAGIAYLGGGALLAACQAATSEPMATEAPAEAPTKAPAAAANYVVRSARIVTPYFFGMPEVYAERSGLFKKNGIEFEVVETGAGAQVAGQGTQLFLAGQTDFATATFPNGLNPFLDGAPIKGIGSFSSMVRHDYWMITTVEIQEWMDFVGRKYVISTPGGPPQSIAEVGFRANNVPVEEIDYVSLGASAQRTQALLAGQVDAALIHPQDAIPILSEYEGTLHLFSDMGKEYPLLFGINETYEKTIEENRDMVYQYIKTEVEAVRALMADQDLAVQSFLQEQPDADPDVLAQVWDTYLAQGVWDPNGAIDVKDLFDKSIDAYVESGGLPEKIEWDDIMDTSVLEEVLNEIGRM